MFFDPDLMGALPDVFVPDTSAHDWQVLFDLVVARGWRWECRQGDTALPLAADAFPRPADTDVVQLKVWPVPGVLAIFRLTSAEEIDFDIDLRELQGQTGVDTLCGFLADIGRELGKPVLLTQEGASQAHPALGFSPAVNRVVLLADPKVRRTSSQAATGIDRIDSRDRVHLAEHPHVPTSERTPAADRVTMARAAST